MEKVGKEPELFNRRGDEREKKPRFKSMKFLLGCFTLFFVTPLKLIFSFRRRRIRRHPNGTISEDPPLVGGGVSVSNEVPNENVDADDIVKEPRHDSKTNANKSVKGPDSEDSTPSKETVSTEIHECGNGTSKRESYPGSRIYDQRMTEEDLVEETDTDYLRNFSLYSVLFLPMISIQFYVSVLLLLFYAHRKKLFEKCLRSEKESKEAERGTACDRCKGSTDEEFPLEDQELPGAERKNQKNTAKKEHKQMRDFESPSKGTHEVKEEPFKSKHAISMEPHVLTSDTKEKKVLGGSQNEIKSQEINQEAEPDMKSPSDDTLKGIDIEECDDTRYSAPTDTLQQENSSCKSEKNAVSNTMENSNHFVDKSNLYGLTPSLTENVEVREKENNTRVKSEEAEKKEDVFLTKGNASDSSQKERIFEYNTERTCFIEEPDDLPDDEALRKVGESNSRITSPINDATQKQDHVRKRVGFENEQEYYLSKGIEQSHPRETTVLETDTRSYGAESFETDSSKPKNEDYNTNGRSKCGNAVIETVENVSAEKDELRTEMGTFTIREKVLDAINIKNSDSTGNIEGENKEKVVGERELEHEYKVRNGTNIKFDDENVSSVCEDAVVASDRWAKTGINEDQTSFEKIYKENNFDYPETFECSENSRENKQLKNSVKNEVLKSNNVASSITNNSLQLRYGPLVFLTNVDDRSKFVFKFRTDVKNRERNKRANRSCEISLKKF